MGNGLGDLEFEEIDDNLGRDDRMHHEASVNHLIEYDSKQFISCSADCTLKVWSKPQENKDKSRFKRDLAYEMSQ